jgi:DNA-binding response OmpR family regulator
VVCQDAARLIREVWQHRQRGADLLYEAYDTTSAAKPDGLPLRTDGRHGRPCRGRGGALRSNDGQRVLVVDDDPTVSDVVRRYLEREGITRPSSPATASRRWTPTTPSARPRRARPDAARHRRARGLPPAARPGPDLPIIMLTALGEESDRVLGLELGADDYVTKPFSPRELVLRVQSVLRRAAPGRTDVGEARRRRPAASTSPGAPQLRGKELALTVREFDLLVFLMRNPGRVLRRTELLEQVWGWTFGDQSTVTVHMRRLREKVEDDPPSRAASSPCGASATGTNMRDVLYTFLMASAARSPSPSRLVVLRGPLRGRSVTAHIVVLLLVTVLSVLAGIVGRSMQDVHLRPRPARAAHRRRHRRHRQPRRGLWAGQRLARASMWAPRPRRGAGGRGPPPRAGRLGLARPAHPAGRAAGDGRGLDDGVVSDPETVADYHRRSAPRPTAWRRSSTTSSSCPDQRRSAAAVAVRRAPR